MKKILLLAFLLNVQITMCSDALQKSRGSSLVRSASVARGGFSVAIDHPANGSKLYKQMLKVASWDFKAEIRCLELKDLLGLRLKLGQRLVSCAKWREAEITDFDKKDKILRSIQNKDFLFKCVCEHLEALDDNWDDDNAGEVVVRDSVLASKRQYVTMWLAQIKNNTVIDR